MNKASIFAATVVLASSARLLHAAPHVHYDLAPRLVDGKIIIEGLTHGVTHNLGTPEQYTRTYWSGEGVRVFEFEFGETALTARKNNNPGFQYLPDSYHINDYDVSGATPVTFGSGHWGFDTSTVLYFTATKALRKWDPVNNLFVAPTDATNMDYGSGYRISADTTRDWIAPIDGDPYSATNSIVVDQLKSNLHQHLYNWIKLGPSGTNPSAGIYLVEAVLNTVGTTGQTAQSDPFFMIQAYDGSVGGFGAGASNPIRDDLFFGAEYDEALAYVNNVLVPEPASLGLIGTVAIGMLRRRRRA